MYQPNEPRRMGSLRHPSMDGPYPETRGGRPVPPRSNERQYSTVDYAAELEQERRLKSQAPRDRYYDDRRDPRDEPRDPRDERRDDYYRDDRRDPYYRESNTRYGGGGYDRYQPPGSNARMRGSRNPTDLYRSLHDTVQSSNEYVKPGGVDENAVALEERRIGDAYYRASRFVEDIANVLYHRTGAMGEFIDEQMDKFKRPNAKRSDDPVFARFADDIKVSNMVYCERIAPVVQQALIDVIGDHIYKNGEYPRKEVVFSYISNILLLAMLVEFGTWLESFDDGWRFLYELSPEARKKLELRDEYIDRFSLSFRNVAGYCGYREPMDFQWKKDLIAAIRKREPSSCPTYDHYQKMREYEVNNWDDYTDSSTYAEPPVAQSSYWDQSFYDAAMSVGNSRSGRRSADRELSAERERSNSPVQDNWSQPYKEEKAQERIVTLENLHEFDLRTVDPLQWFIPIPNTTNLYLVRPKDMVALDQHLTHTGRDKSRYDVWISCILNKVPVVQLDWEKLSYSYKLISIENNREFTMLLTNPEKVIPKLDTRSEEEMVADYRAYTATLKEAEAQRELEANDPNEVKVMDKIPKVILANAPYVFEESKNIDVVLEALDAKAQDKFKGEIGAVVSPFLDCFEMEYAGISHHDAIRSLPQLIEGSDLPPTTLEEFMHGIETVIKDRARNYPNAEWERFRNFINGRFTTAINRWLVEERYFSPLPENKRWVGVKNFFEQWQDALEFFAEHDPETRDKLHYISDNKYLMRRFQFLCNSHSAQAHAEKSTKGMDPDIRDAAMGKILKKSIIIGTKGVITRFNDIWPLDVTGPKLIQRSSSPEMFYILDKAQKCGEKHFGRETNMYFTFSKDPNNTVWTLTPSPVSRDKAMLVPMAFFKPIALQETSISEVIYDQR